MRGGWFCRASGTMRPRPRISRRRMLAESTLEVEMRFTESQLPRINRPLPKTSGAFAAGSVGCDSSFAAFDRDFSARQHDLKTEVFDHGNIFLGRLTGRC